MIQHARCYSDTAGRLLARPIGWVCACGVRLDAALECACGLSFDLLDDQRGLTERPG